MNNILERDFERYENKKDMDIKEERNHGYKVSSTESIPSQDGSDI